MVRGLTGEATPEQRATLHARLLDAKNRIANKSLADEYWSVLKDKFFGSRRARSNTGNNNSKHFGGMRRLSAPATRFVRVKIDHVTTTAEWSRILTAILLRHPFLLHDVQHAYATLILDTTLSQLRDRLLAWAETAETLDFAGLMDHLTKSGCSSEIEQVLTAGAMPLPECTAPTAMPAEAEAGWWHFFGFLNVEHLRQEVALAKAEAERNLTAETQRRLSALRQALIRVESGEPDDVERVDA